MRTVAEEYDCVVGVDTHAATHTMTLLTATGGVVEHRTFPTSAAGLHRALAWIRDRTQTRTCLVVVEGTGSYGAQLTEHFTQGGILVAEAPTVPAARHRGKDDVLDSARIARAVLGLRLDPVSTINRNPVKHQPEPKRQASSGVIQRIRAGGGVLFHDIADRCRKTYRTQPGLSLGRVKSPPGDHCCCC